MNVVISDTAEYGCYLFNHSAVPMLRKFMTGIDTDVIGKGLDVKHTGVDNLRLIQVNDAVRSTSVEQVGRKLRAYMGAMRPIF